MMDVEQLVDNIYAFLREEEADCEKMIRRVSEIGAELEAFESNLHLTCHSIVSAKDIAYSFSQLDNEQDLAWKEMRDFYSTFRHAGRLRRFNAGVLSLAGTFYNEAFLRLKRTGHEQEAKAVQQQGHRYTCPKITSKDSWEIDPSRVEVTPLEYGFEYHNPEAMEDGSFLALRWDWKKGGDIVRIHEGVVTRVQELDVGVPVQSFSKTEKGWLLLGPHGEQAYEFDHNFHPIDVHKLSGWPSKRVLASRTENGYAIFPYDHTIVLLDKEWNITKTLRLPFTSLASEPYFHNGKLYFRNANGLHMSSELLCIDENEDIDCVVDGYDFAPKCSIFDNMIAWPNRNNIHVQTHYMNTVQNFVISLECFNRLKKFSYMKAYHITKVDENLYFFVLFDDCSESTKFQPAILKIKLNTNTTLEQYN